MKTFKRFILIFLIIFASINLSACEQINSFIGNDTEHTETLPDYKRDNVNVYFNFEDGEVVFKRISNKKIIEPLAIPEKKNFKVLGWMDDKGYIHDFDNPFLHDTNLYPKYEIDYVSVTNDLSKNIMSANIKINTMAYNTTLFGTIKKDKTYSQGSGIIFHEQHGNYYVITNEHVINKKNRAKADYTVTDYKGNQYKASLQSGTVVDGYDLAVIYFDKKNVDLHVIEQSDYNPAVGDEVISLGQPLGQNNTISFGKVTGYEHIRTSSGTQHSFDILVHDAPLERGSSGGAILDIEFKLIGLNFAGRFTMDYEFIRAYSIQIEKIKTYLDQYVYL